MRLIVWIFSFIIVGFGFLGSCYLLITGLIGLSSGDAEATYKAFFALLGVFITGLFGATLIRKTIILVVFSALLNTLFIGALTWVAFAPANGPEGPEAAGRGMVVFFLLPFLIVEAGILLNIERAEKLNSRAPNKSINSG